MYFSVFVRQGGSLTSFTSADSWVILSDLERRIKEKIERLGTPLADWDIQINYGVKTGFNDAFIISEETRHALIAQDPKSEEIIRPILRGRDINRYGYEFADQYLIATFPVKNYEINNYPAVKNYLLSFGHNLLVANGLAWVAESYLEEWCHKRLEQTGNDIYINGKKISFKDNEKARKATKNQWFETQDSISYWDDFSKQKIVWGNLNLKASYSIAPEGFFVNAPCPMIIPSNKYLLAILNSKLADYFIRILAKKRNGGYIEYKPMFIERLPVPKISDKQQLGFISLVEEREKDGIDSKLSIGIENKIDRMVYDLYQLTDEEISFIENE